ncbi:24004_t:CDS:2 [Gigaspora rosea]|nr:24004_t:CDS:2 [Gigaspora rosea]
MTGTETQKTKIANETEEQKADRRNRNKNTSKRWRTCILTNSSEVSENSELPENSEVLENSEAPEIPENMENISEHNHKLLSDFCDAIQDLKNKLCLVCNEQFPSIELCDVPQKHQGLTDTEEILIAQHSANKSIFRDFYVRREKIAQALNWLKANNVFYKNIDIDTDILQSLPENGSIIDQLPQLSEEELDSEDLNAGQNTDSYEGDNEATDNGFGSQTFVPSMLPGHSEDVAINETLYRMQQSNSIYESSLHF